MNETQAYNLIVRQSNINNAIGKCFEEVDKELLKHTKLIKKVSRRNVLWTGMLVVSGYLLASVVQEQEKKIDKLTKEIEALRKEELPQEGE